MTRTCNVCRKSKRLEAFPRNRARLLGRAYECRLCNRKNASAWQRANPERARASAAAKDARRHRRHMTAANAIQAHRATLSPADDRTLRRSIYDAMTNGAPFLFGEHKLTARDIGKLGWALSWWQEDILNATELEDERQRVLSRMGE